MELDDLPRATTAELPTLRELFKLEGDEWKEASSDGSETPEHHALDVTNSSSLEPRAMRFVLSFSNLTYSVSDRRKLNFSMLFPRPKNNRLGSPEIKTLLNDISGEARDGEILAVMGASGSGKSTLIDALANRIARGSLKGSVTLNGETIESRLLKAISAYVMQDDLLFPLLTVEETLTFAAEFRLPRALSRSNKKMRVQALIDQLDLGDAAKTVIGDEGHRGVSGGERRRVSIGIDIIHDPIILFLDEPTSGLDSTSAFTVVKVLQRIANTGSIVVMSVHQPSSRILGLIDRMIILSRGEAAFSGSPMQLSIFFSEFGHPIPENENHTEFALDLIRELEEASSTGASSLVEFNESWQSGNNIKAEHNGLSVKEAINASISRGKLVSGTTNTNKSTPISKLPTFANPIWIEIANLTHRSFINSSRTPSQFAVRLAAVLITGFILATVFWRLDNSPKGIQERLGVFSFAVSTAFYTTAQALPVFLQDRHIFLRETAHNAYRRFSYLISLILVAIPPILILSLSFATTTFWALGLDGGKSGFLFYFLILVASFWSASSFVTFLSVLIPNVILGYTIVVKTLASFFLFSGFFVNRNRIPNYWVWFHYLSLVKYPYEAVLQNEFGDPVKCFVRGIQVFDYTPLSGVSKEKKMKLLENLSETLKVNITESTCLTVGENILRRNGVTELNKWNCLWVTVGCGFLFRILFYILLLRSENKRR